MLTEKTFCQHSKDITSFSEKLRDAKFSEFSTLSAKQIEELDQVLKDDIPRLMEVRD